MTFDKLWSLNTIQTISEKYFLQLSENPDPISQKTSSLCRSMLNFSFKFLREFFEMSSQFAKLVDRTNSSPECFFDPTLLSNHLFKSPRLLSWFNLTVLARLYRRFIRQSAISWLGWIFCLRVTSPQASI